MSKLHPSLRFALMPYDLAHILPGARAFARHAAAIGDVVEPDSQGFTDTVVDMLNMPGVRVLLAFKDAQQCVGGFGYFVAPYLWARHRLAVHELFWWVYPGAAFRTHERLVAAGLEDAAELGATIKTFGALYNSPPGVDRFYRRNGLKPLQITYFGEMGK